MLSELLSCQLAAMLNTLRKTVLERSFARLWAQADGTGESMMISFRGTNPNQFWVQRSAQAAEPLVVCNYN